MKVWYAVIQMVGCDSGELTVFAQGVYSDLETAKRALFDTAKKRNFFYSDDTYEDTEWRDGHKWSKLETVNGKIQIIDIECSEIQLDATMDTFR